MYFYIYIYLFIYLFIHSAKLIKPIGRQGLPPDLGDGPIDFIGFRGFAKGSYRFARNPRSDPRPLVLHATIPAECDWNSKDPRRNNSQPQTCYTKLVFDQKKKV